MKFETFVEILVENLRNASFMLSGAFIASSESIAVIMLFLITGVVCSMMKDAMMKVRITKKVNLK